MLYNTIFRSTNPTKSFVLVLLLYCMYRLKIIVKSSEPMSGVTRIEKMGNTTHNYRKMWCEWPTRVRDGETVASTVNQVEESLQNKLNGWEGDWLKEWRGGYRMELLDGATGQRK